jgi:catechol 2,3-dioxygenase-like lactoylglutathione lyase family enzyme
MPSSWNSRSGALALFGILIAGCRGEPVAPPDIPGGPFDLVLGDSTRVLTLDSGQMSREYHLTVSARTEVAVFVQAIEGFLQLQVIHDGVDEGALGVYNGRDLLGSRTDRYLVKDLSLVVSRYEPDSTSSVRYRLLVYPVNRAPEHGAGTVTLGQVRRDEDLETSADIDEYDLVGQAGKDLVGYLGNEPAYEQGFFLGFYGPNDQDRYPIQAVTSAETGVPLEDNGTQLFTVPQGRSVVRVVGSANLPVHYQFVLRQGSRRPETAPATVGTNAVISEALDYTGDIGMIAFLRGDPYSADRGLYVVTADGSAVRRIAPGDFVGGAYWSHDGSMIATYIEDPPHGWRPVVVTVATGKATRLEPAASHYAVLRNPWSFDDSQLLTLQRIDGIAEGGEELLVADLHGSYRRLTADSVTVTDAVWVP